MRIQDLEIQKQQCLEEMKEWMNDLGIREYQKEEIDIDYRRKCEDKIYELKDKFNESIIDDDDDDLGFYAVHPNTIHTPVSQNVEPKDSLIMGDGHINTTPETEAISVETLVSNPSESDDFSLGECNLFDIDDSYYEKSREDGGEIDLDISKIVDISLREKLVESYLLIEKINAFSLSPSIPISPILCHSIFTIPVVDIDLPLEEADLPSFSDDSILRGIESDRDSGKDTTSIDDLPLDDSMILSEYESFTFDDEPVMAKVNVFDEINTSELSYPVIGFPDFGSFVVQKLWKDKAMLTISIDGLQSSFHKMGNLLSLLCRKRCCRDNPQTLAAEWDVRILTPVVVAISYLGERPKKGLKGQKEAKTVKNRQGTKETRKRVKKQPKIKAGSADTAIKEVKAQNKSPRTKVDKCSKIRSLFEVLKIQGPKLPKVEK
ncbi:hypothetical protein Tco_1352744 [Tanacetum coccineum]